MEGHFLLLRNPAVSPWTRSWTCWHSINHWLFFTFELIRCELYHEHPKKKTVVKTLLADKPTMAIRPENSCLFHNYDRPKNSVKVVGRLRLWSIVRSKCGTTFADSFLIPKWTFEIDTTEPCDMIMIHDRSYLQSMIGQYHIMDFLSCLVWSDINKISRTFGVCILPLQ